MKEACWTTRYAEVYEEALRRYRSGVRSADGILDDEALAFLQQIGGTAQELFDLVEDCARGGEPDYGTALLLTAARRDYFLNIDHGQWREQLPSSSLPPKPEELQGIPWLPRIIEKAKRKLQGTMDRELMYGCGGDRRFSREHDIHLADFLQIVRGYWNEPAKIAAIVKRQQPRT